MNRLSTSSSRGRAFTRSAWFLCSLLLFTGYVCLQANAHNNGQGIGGRTQKGGNTAGCTCHCASATSATTVTIATSASTIYTNGTYTFTVTVANTSESGAGFEVAVQRGSLTAGSGMQLISGELTQTTAATSLPATWTFTYTAPSTAGADTLFATGNAVNLDGMNGGGLCTDVWNFSPKYVVNVQTPPITKAIALSRSSIAIGSVRVGNSKKDTMQIRSTSTSAISVSTSLNSGAMFSRYPTSTGRSISGGSQEIDTLTFAPTARGAFSDSLIITSDVDAATDQRKAVYLSGTGIQAVFNGGTTLSFGNTRVGHARLMGFVYSNTGDDTLFMQTPSISGSGFTITAQPTKPNLPPGGTDSIVVQLNPTSNIAYSGSLTLSATGLTISSVALSGNGVAPVISVTSPTTIGGVRVGHPTQGSVTVRNTTGTDTLHVATATLSGSSASLFNVGGTIPFAVPPGGQGTIVLNYTPTLEKLDSATLTIASDDNASPSSVVMVIGQGLLPHMAVAQTDTLDFGNVRINSGAVTKDIAVQNTGTDVLNLSPAVVGPLPFSLKAQNSTVDAGTSTPVTVGFAPTAVGPFTGSVVISGDDPRNPSATVYVKGTGISSALSLPSTVDFGSVPALLEHDTTITITNTGSASVNILGYALSGASQFGILDSSAHAIGGNASITVKLKFLPTAAKGYIGTLTISTDDPNLKSLTVGLSGTGVKGAIGISPDSLDFGTIDTLTTKIDTVQILNTGTASITVDVISLAGSGQSAYTVTPLSASVTIPPAGVLKVPVTFTPPNPGRYDATLSIHTTNDVTTTVGITGQGKQKPAGVAMTSPTEGWSLGISPNPSKDRSELSLEMPTSTNVTIRLYDATGRMLREVFNGHLTEGSHRLQLVTSGLADGAYFMRVMAAGVLRGESKILIQR